MISTTTTTTTQIMGNVDDIFPSNHNHHRHHSSHHPELEHLAATMPPIGTNQLIQQQESTTTPTTIRSQSRMSISHDKGLLNMPGQNNCFLNSAVQVLWHLDIFRRSFRELHGHACMGDSCIFCALKELFNQFQSSTESALPPDSLRFALAQAFSDQRRFRLGYMDDAAECFENILFRIHYHITNQELDSSNKCLPHCIPHQKFSMNLYEQIVCYSCGATSEPFMFSQMVHYISTSALCVQAQMVSQSNQQPQQQQPQQHQAKFGDLFKKASSMGDVRNCPKMCGARMNIKKFLLNRPDIISIGLVWDTDHPSLTLIRNVYHLIQTTIHLNGIFDLSKPSRNDKDGSNKDGCVDYDNGDGDDNNDDDRKQLDLVGLVTYYGKHYSTYIFNTKLSQWIYFDDATVRVVGNRWQQVVEKCIKGHFQPLLLLYSNPKASLINTQYASMDLIPMTVIKKPETLKNHHHLHQQQYHQHPRTSTCAQKLQDQSSSLPSSIDQQHVAIVHNNTNKNSIHNYSDVPDSPSATSTTSYFSDVVDGDSTDGYISRKTVEDIIKIQQHQRSSSSANHKKIALTATASITTMKGHNFTTSTTAATTNYNRKYNRNSSSSLESFDSAVRRCGLLSQQQQQQQKNNELQTSVPLSCMLQRRDSGNSSGDRASSASSNEAIPYYPQRRLMAKIPSSNVGSSKQTTTTTTSKINSDQGYDSFSLSSSDSYPSTTSPSKMNNNNNNNRLKQIPEDVQLIDNMVNNLSMMDECDKLCSEADILLLKSHEKEREGDLRAAAALSDSAAAKARLAMDIPYSNHQTLISAKMKHSMCVMRSASLHKRVLELEVEEKRLLKAAMEAAVSSHHHHSRQSSRDSSHGGRHSRQGSKDGKDPTNNRNNKQQQQNDSKCSTMEKKDSSSSSSLATANKLLNWSSPFNLEVYATLPKKIKRKSHSTKENSNATTTAATSAIPSVENELTEQKIYENLKPAAIAKGGKQQFGSGKSKKKYHQIIESDFSDYYSEWEAIRKKRSNKNDVTAANIKVNPSSSNSLTNGWQSCKEYDESESGYAEFTASKNKINNNHNNNGSKKQCKVKRKLMFGNFLKTKNRSLPDLREESLAKDQQQQQQQPEAESSSLSNSNLIYSNILNIRSNQDELSSSSNGNINQNKPSSVANINAKGFHQSHKSFLAEQGLKTSSKPLLIKVKPPLLQQPQPSQNNHQQLDDLNSSITTAANKLPNETAVEVAVGIIGAAIGTVDCNNPKKLSSFSNCKKHYTTEPINNNNNNNNNKRNSFLEELNRKRNEILKCSHDNELSSMSPSPKSVPAATTTETLAKVNSNGVENRSLNNMMATSKNPHHNDHPNQHQKLIKKKPSLFEIANLINASRNGATAATPTSHDIITSNKNHMVGIIGDGYQLQANQNQTNLSKQPPQAPVRIPKPINPILDYGSGGGGAGVVGCVNGGNHVMMPRPQKPPDYETALKRRMMSSNNLPSVMTPLSGAGSCPSPIYSNLMEQQQINDLPPPPPIPHPHNPPKVIHTQTTNSNSSTLPPPPKVTNHHPKKSVKFSDHIELVACADDDDLDEPLPNLLFEKVLGSKKLIYTLQQQQQQQQQP